MKKVLFLTLHRKDRSPSQRFRFEQYIPFLEKNGFECTHSFLLDAKDDKIFYSPGAYTGKFLILIKSIRKRIKEVSNASQYDIVFVQRECFMLGTSYFEKKFKSKSKLIFDLDDSIWLQNVSAQNKKLSFLKDSEKTNKIMQMSDLIFAGNEYIKNYALNFNKNVTIVPTTIDTQEYQRIKLKDKKDTVCIGWSGSITTIEHFKYCLPALSILKKKYGDKIEIQVIGDGTYRNEELGIIGLPWKKDTELKDLSKIDIGLMPLPNDEWASGKCGLKGLQYMALEIATIMSPVGVNTEIIQDCKNGFLAESMDEYVSKISILIEDEQLRKQLGLAGRKTVIDHYSVSAIQHIYLNEFARITQ